MRRYRLLNKVLKTLFRFVFLINAIRRVLILDILNLFSNDGLINLLGNQLVQTFKNLSPFGSFHFFFLKIINDLNCISLFQIFIFFSKNRIFNFKLLNLDFKCLPQFLLSLSMSFSSLFILTSFLLT